MPTVRRKGERKMGRFFRNDKNEKNEEVIEDFVLFGDEKTDEDEPENSMNIDEGAECDNFAESGEERQTDTTNNGEGDADANGEGEELQNTQQLELNEVNGLIARECDDEHEFNPLMSFILNHKRTSVCAAILVIAIVLSAVAYGIILYSNPLRAYAQVAAEKENIMRTMEVEGTLQTGNKYNITSLVSGKIVSSDVEVGDVVKKNDVLYKIDDTDAKLAVERAQNELAKAGDTTINNSSDTARIVSTEAGTIQSLSIRQGSVVNAGTRIGTILRSDGTTAALTSYISGTVSLVSVAVGRTVSIGQVIASVKTGGSSSEESAKYNKKTGEIDVQSAQRQLENYTIKSPVAGVVIEKNNRAGDNVGIANSENPMMVILDTSTLTFTFDVDEYGVNEVEKGQEVTVTAESMPDETYTGEVSYVSAEGKADEYGNPKYEVCVSVSDPGSLKAGMKVNAKVILASSNKAIAIPQQALLKSDGQNALVLVKNDITSAEADEFNSESVENRLAYPDIKVPKGCSLVSVKYGISDGTVTEILAGIKVGDMIVYNPKINTDFVASTITSDDDKNDKSSSKDDVLSDDVAEDGGENYSVDNESDDHETEQQIKDEINEILSGTNEL